MRKTFPRGVAALPFAGILLSAAALAQNAQGQFTPDANAPIQLHMPVHLHLPPKPKARAVHHRRPKAAASQAHVSAPASSETGAVSAPSGSVANTETARPAVQVRPAHQAVNRAAPELPRAQRRKAEQEVLSGAADATSASSAAGDVYAPNAAIPFSFDTGSPPPKSSPPALKPPKEKVAAQPALAAEPKSGGAPAKPKSGSAPPPRPHGDIAALSLPPKQVPASKPAAVPEKPKGDPHAGLTKQSEILFDGSSTDPQADGASALKESTAKLNAALDKGAANVEVEAYGGSPGDKSSEARRLSLRRALAVRQLLIDGGIPASRIVVKAEGGADDKGNPQRVDVYLRGAPG